MRDDRLREILSVTPGAEEERLRSARARKRAIAGYDSRPRQSHWRVSVAVAGLAILLVGAWIAQRSAHPDGGAAAEQRRIEMRLQLSDGTRVNWVIDGRYAL
jgi:hypothetical protein